MMTPIECVGSIKSNRLFVKRDDLLPFSFGGNKYRIAIELFKDMEQSGCDCIIGYGNARSNMCRAISNIAYSRGVPCYIISPADDDGNRVDSFNSKIVSDCNANIVFCLKSNVAETVSMLMNDCLDKGMKPYYIYGNKLGQGNETVLSKAYSNVFAEIVMQEKELNTSFDLIFLAAGTGMTYSGLVIGRNKLKSDKKIVGISVARNQQQCYKVLNNYLKLTGNDFKGASDFVEFIDDYLCGGYGKYNDEIEKTIKLSLTQFGIPLDPVYTGKAFYGMCSYLEDHKIEDKNILFLHTGGTPLFFDYYKEKM